MTRIAVIGSVFLISLSAVSISRAALITATFNNVRSDARDGLGTIENDVDTSTALPHSATLSADAGTSESTTHVDWLVNAGEAVLKFDLEHVRAGSKDSFARSSRGFGFTANVNLDYDLSGLYSMVGDGGLVRLDVTLSDQTNNVHSILFDNIQESRSIANESFTLGQLGGNATNGLSGNLTGTLTAGNTYVLEFNAVIMAGDDGGAAATGNVTLTLTDQNVAVPEPTTLAIWSLLGGIGLVVCHRRRKRKAA